MKSIVQKVSASAGNSANNVTFPNGNTAGNLIIVAASWLNCGTATVADSAGNTYVSAIGPTTNAGSSQIWYAANIVAATSNQVNVTFSCWNNSTISVFEYSGLATSSPLDAATANTGNSNSLDTGYVTTTQANELIFATGYGNSGGTLTADPSYTMEQYNTWQGTHLGVEDRSVSSTGTYHATFSDTAAWTWQAQIAAFKAASSSSLCGQLDDGLTHPAPNYDTFAPGAAGTTYNDPQYGCPVTRISDGKTYCNSASVHDYSTLSAINADNSLIIMSLAWQCHSPSAYYVMNTDGTVIVDQNHFPITNPGTHEPNTGNIPWDQFDSNTFYYTVGTTLYQGTINRTTGTINETQLCSFSGYSEVDIPDQEDISYDNNHLWLVGNPNSSSGQAFLVTLTPSTGTHTGCTAGATVNIGAKEASPGWHKIQNTPLNKLAVLMLNTSGNTTQLYNTDGTLFRTMSDTIHMDFGYDADGVTEVAVGMFYQGTAQNGCSGNYGLGVENLATGAITRCLLPGVGADNAFHVSFRDTAPRGPGWVLLSSERSITCNSDGTGTDMSCFNGNANWYPYSGEEVLIRIDSTEVRRLAHHRSRASVSYWPQPRGSLSKDGKVVIFDSNFNNFNGGTSTVSGLDYADTYMIRVHQ